MLNIASRKENDAISLVYSNVILFVHSVLVHRTSTVYLLMKYLYQTKLKAFIETYQKRNKKGGGRKIYT